MKRNIIFYFFLLCSISIFAQGVITPPRTCTVCKVAKPASDFSGDSKICKACAKKKPEKRTCSSCKKTKALNAFSESSIYCKECVKKLNERVCQDCKMTKFIRDFSSDSKTCKDCVAKIEEQERIAQKKAEQERVERELTKKAEREDKEGVDLELPSGTLWATKNVGANSPEEYGDKFAWGETKGFMNGKSNFSWSTYKWGKESDKLWTYTIKLTKYYNKKTYGKKPDGKTELDLEDDAASVNLGSKWCMPSEEQFVELIKMCTWIWTTYKGTKGYIVKGKNGNSIFLPAAGYDHRFHDAETRGCYWTSSLFANNPTYAYYLDFSESSWSSTYFYRYYGRSVRPVRVKLQD